MDSVREIEKAVRDLPEEELKRFRAWYEEFDAERWDRQFEDDVAKGKLDDLAAQALQDLNAGKATKI